MTTKSGKTMAGRWELIRSCDLFPDQQQNQQNKYNENEPVGGILKDKLSVFPPRER